MSRLPSLSVDGGKAISLIHYGQALQEMGMESKALQQFDFALELNPKSPIVFHKKGLVYLQKEQYIHAIRCFDQALQIQDYIELYFDKGNAHLALNQIDKAIECYITALTHYPNNANIYYQLGVAHYSKNNVVTALKYLSQAILLDYNLIKAYQKQGEIYYDIKMFKKAIQTFDKVLHHDSLNYKAQYSKGLTYFEMDQKEKAIKCFEKCILLQSNYALPYFNKGIILYQLGQYRDALRYFKDALRRNSKHEQSQFYLGLTFQKLNQLDKAMYALNKCTMCHQVAFNQALIQQTLKLYHKAQELFKKAIKLECNNQDYWYYYGINYFYLDNLEEMAECFEKVIALNGVWILKQTELINQAVKIYHQQYINQPKTQRQYFRKGRILCILTQFDQAIEAFNNSLKIEPLNVETKLGLAKAYESQQKYEEAIRIYISMNDIKALFRLMELLQYLKLPEGAIIILDKILDYQPNNLEALYNKGLCLQILQKFEQAIMTFDYVLKIHPKSAEAILQKGIALINLGEKMKAESQFLKIINFIAENESVLLLQGHSYFHIHKMNEAIECYQKVISIDPDFSEGYFGLGFVYYQRKEYYLAVKTYKSYLMKHKNSKQFLLALANALHKLGKNKSAHKYLDQLLNLEKFHTEAIHAKAIIYYDQKNFQKSFQNYTRAIKCKPQNNKLLKLLYQLQ